MKVIALILTFLATSILSFSTNAEPKKNDRGTYFPGRGYCRKVTYYAPNGDFRSALMPIEGWVCEGDPGYARQ